VIGKFGKCGMKKEICFYGVSLTGSSHALRGVVCQDAHKIQRLKNGCVIAAVADGVGSAKRADIASRIAADSFVGFCAAEMKDEMTVEETEALIKGGYALAESNIEAESLKAGESIIEYDTTLSAVIFNGKRIVYGHSGDGGIVGLTTDGEYKRITFPQKAADGVCVIPLRAGKNTWEIGHCADEYASVLLATDGVYDILFPYLLKGQECEIYIPLIRYFMDNTVLGISEDNQKEIEESRTEFLSSDACANITDDKTVVVLINAGLIPALRGADYYAEPDWDALQSLWNKKAYPHLYKANESV
jgi:serine/threonine protein phosphatase PrpC